MNSLGFKFYQIGVLDNFPNQIHFDMDNITVRELFMHLSEKYSRDIENYLIDEGDRIKSEYVLILNGVNIVEYQGLDSIIPKDSELLLSVLMFGG